MDRRQFIKGSAIAIAAGSTMSIPGAARSSKKSAEDAAYPSPRKGSGVAKDFKYNSDGKFKVLQLTDTHVIFGDPRSERAYENVGKMLDLEKPDLVIHTGDIIFGEPAEEGARKVLGLIADRKIPFAVALGNHDSQFGLDRKGIYDVIRTIPYNINTPADKGIAKASNDVITLSGAEGVDRVFYLFDSGDRMGIADAGYDNVHIDQIEWYDAYSREFKAKNGGNPVSSLAFFHIPPAEFDYCLRLTDDKGWNFIGHMGEHIGCSKLNSGLFQAMKMNGDVQAIVCGHEHNNDFVMQYKGIMLIYGRFSGCDTVYNDLKPNGARVFEFSRGERGFYTWVRLNSGEVEHRIFLDPPMENNFKAHKEPK
ncbi:MAG: metallophosphoesterase family protein [Bacteroidales bacterium]|nr:metallophosphoesterase family protein [Bacteroidales bacterium]